MKRMRFLILIGIIFLISCSNENNKPITENNLIVGTWKAVREVNVCSSGSELVSEYSVCQLQTEYKFRAHSDPTIKNAGTADLNIFYDDGEDCIEINYINGTWTLNDSILNLTFPNITLPPITIFKLNSNILQAGFITNVENLACEGEHLSAYQYRELIRVE